MAEERLRYLKITNKIRRVLVQGLDNVPSEALNKSRKLRRSFAKACDALELDEEAEKSRADLFRRINLAEKRLTTAASQDETELASAALDVLREELEEWDGQETLLVLSEATIEAIQELLDPKSGAQPFTAGGLRIVRQFLIDLESARVAEDGSAWLQDPRSAHGKL